MKKFLKVFIPVVALAGLTFEAGAVYGQSEAQEHPRVAAAIEALRGARTELQEAPHDFGGHKASAIASVDHALEELHFALIYRAGADHGHPEHPHH